MMVFHRAYYFLLSRVECNLKHSSSVDDIKSDQRYWQKRLQLRHSCTGENSMISFKISRLKLVIAERNEAVASPQLEENQHKVLTELFIEYCDAPKFITVIINPNLSGQTFFFNFVFKYFSCSITKILSSLF